MTSSHTRLRNFSMLLLVLALTARCGATPVSDSARAAVPPARVAATVAPAATSVTTLVPVVSSTSSGSVSQPADTRSATVVRMIDGDTVDVRLDSRTERVRLIGIDTPETVDGRKPVQCFGREASARAKELLDGQTVALETDDSQDTRDRYGRLLGYLWLRDGRQLNHTMIADT